MNTCFYVSSHNTSLSPRRDLSSAYHGYRVCRRIGHSSWWYHLCDCALLFEMISLIETLRWYEKFGNIRLWYFVTHLVFPFRVQQVICNQQTEHYNIVRLVISPLPIFLWAWICRNDTWGFDSRSAILLCRSYTQVGEITKGYAPVGLY